MKILIVDDNSTNRKLLRVMLQGEGHEGIEAIDGVDALEILQEKSVDAVISDILMPRMDGFRLCYEIRRRANLTALPFIFHTSTYTSPGDERAALSLGADKFLRKPAPIGEILVALQDARRRASQPLRSAGAEIEELNLIKQYSERLSSKLASKNTELRSQGDSLRGARQQLRLQATALQTAANAIVITDQAGILIWANPAFAELNGYSVEETRGKNLRLLQSGKHAPEFYQTLWQTILSGKSWRGEFTNRRKNGTLYFAEQTITPVYSHAGSISHFVGVMNDTTERKRAEEKSRHSREQLRALAGRLLLAREEEQTRIAREIHDGMGEVLTGIEMRLSWVRRLLERKSGPFARRDLLQKLEEISSLTQGAFGRVRKLCTELRPPILDDMGLIPAIEWQAREFQQRTRIRCHLKLEKQDLPLTADQATAIFRIFQEILTNVARHAHASRVDIRLRQKASKLLLEIKDNGKGMPTVSGPGSKSLGLLGMRERAALISGEVTFFGCPGKGTTVSVLVPLVIPVNLGSTEKIDIINRKRTKNTRTSHAVKRGKKGKAPALAGAHRR